MNIKISKFWIKKYIWDSITFALVSIVNFIVVVSVENIFCYEKKSRFWHLTSAFLRLGETLEQMFDIWAFFSLRFLQINKPEMVSTFVTRSLNLEMFHFSM